MSTETRQSHTLAGWTEMFAGFERNLDQWLARLVELGPEPAPQHAESIALQGFEERLKRLQTYLDRAEANAEQALAPLTTEIQSMRQWLETLNVARSRFGESWLRSPSSADEAR